MKQDVEQEPANDATSPGRNAADRTSAVSESIGVVLLIALVVALVALVGMFLYSQPAPAEVPNVNFMAGLNDASTILYLYHNGGDTLTVGEFSVLVDGVVKPYTVSGGGTQWSLGTNLAVPITTVPSSVQIVYNGTGVGSTGGAVLLHSGSVNRTKLVNITEDKTPYLDCAAAANWDCADQIPPWIIIAQYTKNTTTRRLMFMQSWQAAGIVKGSATGEYHFNFTVTGTNSSIHIATAANPNCDAGNLYYLPVGTQVQVAFIANPTFFTVYGMAPQIWELVAGAATNIKTQLLFTNGTRQVYYQRTVCHAYISQYSDLDSTITVNTSVSGRVTSLIINNTIVFPGATTTRGFNISRIQPIDNGLFLVTYGASNTPVYVIGWPQNVSWTP